METTWIVWVGGIDDHYQTQHEAEQAYQRWIREGYDDIQIQEVAA